MPASPSARSLHSASSSSAATGAPFGLDRSQTIAVASEEEEAILRPSGKNATAVIPARCPLNRRTSRAEASSQTRTEQSFPLRKPPLPEARSRPSGEKASVKESSPCPLIWTISRPESMCQTRVTDHSSVC